MCGIAGFAGSGDPGVLKRMLSLLKHRGPDDQGTFFGKNIGLGMRRLSVIDLKTGRQPQANEEGDVHIVFNGEIYNYRQLRKVLEAKGHRFSTSSDTEAIVHAYEECGTDCVQLLRGMFAFAIWDARKKALFLARDRLGKKPLYYAWNGGVFYFASELKALTETGVAGKELDWRALDEFLTFQYIPAPRTIFSTARKLQAGHSLWLSKGKLQAKKYWDLFYKTDLRHSPQFFEQEIRKRLLESVRLRLISDVPLGAFLSGGVDSSAVVAAMACQASGSVKTFSIGFEESGYSELAFARKTSEHLQTRHYEKVVRPKDVIKSLPDIAWHADEPFADPSAVPTYLVSQLARKHVTVALSGDGGDENFAGYDRYAVASLLSTYSRLPAGLRNAGTAAARTLLSLSGRHLLSQRAEKFDSLARLSPPRRYAELVSFFRKNERRHLYAGALQRKSERFDSEKAVSSLFHGNNATDPLDKMLYADFRSYIPEDILMKVDRASMAHSLEARNPILDHEFVEFCATIPSSMKFRNLQGKLVFKRAVRDWLPREILTRKKRGFGLPLGPWFKGEVGEFLEQEIDAGAACKKLFDPGVVQRMLEEHRKGRAAYSYKLWALLELELWRKAFKFEF